MVEDVLLYYAEIFPKLKKFLKNREIATKTYLKDIEFMKRGSHDGPLFIDELIKNVNKKFLDLRKGESHLKEVRDKLNKKQVQIWEYFVPRKLIELHYATNHEYPNKPLDRIYFDIDRKNIPAEKAQIVALKLIETIRKDKSFKLKYKIFVMWTGTSFHVYLLLKKKISHSFYEKNIHASLRNQEASFTGRWAMKVNKELKNIKVVASHEKKYGVINIDPSQSPSGKMARCPLSLYIKRYNKISGVAIPLSIDDLKDKDLVKKLRNYNKEKVLNNLSILSRKLP
ncbi:MAG: hypothetical protein AABW46_03320 [Nanoarchaeota archaeon]